ncbi:hypothetical protein T02_9982 [Trichinella nativa]|uniref:Uncharacterized protein n=1 Tax=Trichinella nativa TaxID=6335 RepID=A0A0V1LS31_9BILA|nr:hypothetical protein T02_9982 [Trichinella nativa]
MQWTMKAVPGTGWTSPVPIEDVCVRPLRQAENRISRLKIFPLGGTTFKAGSSTLPGCSKLTSVASGQQALQLFNIPFIFLLGFELDHAGNHVDQGSKTVRLFRQIWHLLPKQLEHCRSGTGTFHRIFVDYSRRRGGKFKRRPVGAVARRQRRISDRILLGVGCMASWKLECTTARTIDRGSILYNNRRRRRSQLGTHWGRVIHCPRCPWLIWTIIRIGCVPSSMFASLFRTRFLSNLSTKQLGGIATDYCQAENNVVYFIHATKQATTGDKLSCLNNFSSATPPDTEDTCKEHLGRHC